MRQLENVSMPTTPSTHGARTSSASKVLSVQELRAVLATLPAHLPLSDAFENGFPQRQGVWWSSQREHMLGWLDHQQSMGDGKFTRKAPNASSRVTYARLNSGPAIVWIAEALGVGTETVETTVAVARAEPNIRKHCGLLRQYLPWALIAERARGLVPPRR